MWKRSTGSLLLLALGTAAAAVGAYALIGLRLGAGDVYPPYSSLRADPLGTKILHDSLAERSGFRVARSYQPLNKLEAGPGSAVFHLGDGWWGFSYLQGETFAALHDYLRRGGVLITAARPVNYVPATNETPWLTRMREQAGLTNQLATQTFSNRWGFAITFEPVGEDWTIDKTVIGDTNRAGVAVAADGEGRPLTCRTTTILRPDAAESAWRTRYTRDGHPVVIERAYGRGRLVVCAEAYPFSNEALVRERPSALLADWLAGCTNILFAEEHHGISEQVGIMTLVNRYGLQGAVLALLVLAGLFVWRQAAPLVPAIDETRGPDYALVAGRQSAEGLVQLLRRAVPPGRLLATCWQEWTRQAAATTPPAKRARMEQALALTKPDAAGAVAGYRRMGEILSERDR